MEISIIVASIVISVVVLLMTREIFLWYWKVNKIVKRLDDIHELALMVLSKELEERKVTVINLASKKEQEFTIKQFLELPNKNLYKLK